MNTGINGSNGSIGGNGQPQVADLHVQEVIRSAVALVLVAAVGPSFSTVIIGGPNS